MATANKKSGVKVGLNGNLPVQKTPGSKGVKSGVNTKVSASSTAKGRTGGTSSAPKTAIPKAKYGMTMKKGGMKKSC
ncbi:MAG: hypothetical protein NTY55_02460 [Flavobacteriia bacterium]|nr:hypothetical protein [Flavobacteriia bacterium]